MMERLYCGDCSVVMENIDSDYDDLTVSSPPYDDLRTYEGYHWNVLEIIDQLYRITKPGGIVVWIVGDSVVDGSETLSSFKQAIAFKECGFRVHDTMIWEKSNFANPASNRYHQIFEYMFVFSKGKLKTFHPILDVKTTNSAHFGKNTHRQKDGTMIPQKDSTPREWGMRKNVWKTITAGQENPGKRPPHPAMFPKCLVRDHIISWSNEGDTVLDPFMGSGTTGIVAKQLNRNFIGIEISSEYYNLAQERIDAVNPLDKFLD